MIVAGLRYIAELSSLIKKENTVKHQRLGISFISALLLLLSGCSAIPGMGNNVSGASALIGMLTSQLGVSNEQALGGAAALFGLAKQSLSAGDFSNVTKSLPGVGSLLGAASMGGDSSNTNSGGGLASVAGQFSSLGLSPDMAGKFVPVVLDYAKSAGGDNTMSLLQGVLK